MKVEELEADKRQIINDYKKQLDSMLAEKEEVQVQARSLEDKVHKMETDREQMRVKAKQQLQKIDEISNQLEDQDQKIIELQNKIRSDCEAFD